MLEMTAEEIVSELVMTTSAKPALAVMLVEGDTDESLYRALFTESASQSIVLLPAGNQCLVNSAMAIINARKSSVAKLPPAVGIIDQDYLIPLGRRIESNVFVTDLRDVECMMLASESLKCICDDYVDWKRAKAAGVSDVAALRQAALSVCAPLGKLRYWSQSTNTHLVFKHLDISECLNRPGTALDTTAVLNKLRGAQAAGARLPPDAFFQADEHCKQQPHFTNDLLICRGHDLVEILAAQLRKKWGRPHARAANAAEIGRNLRMSFPRFWQSTRLIGNLKHWFTQHGLAHLQA